MSISEVIYYVLECDECGRTFDGTEDEDEGDVREMAFEDGWSRSEDNERDLCDECAKAAA